LVSTAVAPGETEKVPFAAIALVLAVFAVEIPPPQPASIRTIGMRTASAGGALARSSDLRTRTEPRFLLPVFVIGLFLCKLAFAFRFFKPRWVDGIETVYRIHNAGEASQIGTRRRHTCLLNTRIDPPVAANVAPGSSRTQQYHNTRERHAKNPLQERSYPQVM